MTARITDFFHSRYAAFAAVAVMIAAAWSAFAAGNPANLPVDPGPALPPAGCWLPAEFSLWASIAANIALIGLLVFINRHFNLLRSLSALFVVLFAAMQTAIPELTSQFYTGTLLAVVLASYIALMFGSYMMPTQRREVFLVFVLISAGAATQLSFAVYIPVMLLCCMQMRVMSWRTLLAALLGIITPWWLLLGLGIVEPAQLRIPGTTDIFSIIDFSADPQSAATILLSAGVFTASVLLDFLRTMAYNARSRSYNGVIVLTGFVTIAAIAVDFRNAAAYLPALNMCAALQAAQFFILHRGERSWIGISCLLAAYLSLFIWKSFA